MAAGLSLIFTVLTVVLTNWGKQLMLSHSKRVAKMQLNNMVYKSDTYIFSELIM